MNSRLLILAIIGLIAAATLVSAGQTMRQRAAVAVKNPVSATADACFNHCGVMWRSTYYLCAGATEKTCQAAADKENTDCSAGCEKQYGKRTIGADSAYRHGQKGQAQDVNGRHHAESSGRFQKETATNTLGQKFDRRTGRFIAADTAKPFAGKYVSGRNEFKLTSIGKNRLHVNFFGLAGNAPNMGEFECTLTVDKKGAGQCVAFEKCKVSFAFSPSGKLITSQSSDNCGFGMGVRADGAYTKKVKAAAKPATPAPAVNTNAAAPAAANGAAPAAAKKL